MSLIFNGKRCGSLVVSVLAATAAASATNVVAQGADDAVNDSTSSIMHQQSPHLGSMDLHHGPSLGGTHDARVGNLMLSLSHRRMWMEGSLIGSSEVSPEIIVTTVPNRFFGLTGQPTTLRVVPVEMTVDMTMLGAMYGANEWLTVMGMVPYVEKEMEHVTFAGPIGTTRLGRFTTRSEGIGDASIKTLIDLLDHKAPGQQRKGRVSIGLSVPTGSIADDDAVLTPLGAQPSQRLPYPMQIGSGTWDALVGLNYSETRHKWSWGAEYDATIRLEDANDEGYALGDIHQASAWLRYRWEPWIGTSLGLQARTLDRIEGIDPLILAPVQTADPRFQGVERLDLQLGLNLTGQAGFLCGHRANIELGMPVYQNLNGPQLELDQMFSINWRKTFGNC